MYRLHSHYDCGINFFFSSKLYISFRDRSKLRPKSKELSPSDVKNTSGNSILQSEPGTGQRKRRGEEENPVSLEYDADDTSSSSQHSLSSNSNSQEYAFSSSPIDEYYSSKENNNNDSFAFWDEKMQTFSGNSLFDN